MPWLVVSLLLLTQCATQKTEPIKKVEEPRVSQQEIRAAIASHKSYLSDCYGKALLTEKGAKLKGTVLVYFKVGPDGKASAPQVIKEKSTLHNESLNQCLFAGITSWDFPVDPEGEDLEIRYPFQFRDTPPAGMQKKMDQFEKLRNR